MSEATIQKHNNPCLLVLIFIYLLFPGPCGATYWWGSATAATWHLVKNDEKLKGVKSNRYGQDVRSRENHFPPSLGDFQCLLVIVFEWLVIRQVSISYQNKTEGFK